MIVLRWLWSANYIISYKYHVMETFYVRIYSILIALKLFEEFVFRCLLPKRCLK
jgi:hypothetical protein